MTGFLAFLFSNPWRAAAFALAMMLILAGVGLKIERSAKVAALERVASLQEAVRTWEGLVAQRDMVIRQQNEAIAKLQTDAQAAEKRARAAIAAVTAKVKQVEAEADRLRRRLAEASDALTCEDAVEEVRRGLLP